MSTAALDRLLMQSIGKRKPSLLDTATTGLIGFMSLPITILPKWYFGAAALSGFGLIIAGQLGYITAVAWYVALAAVIIPVAPLVATYLFGFACLAVLVVATVVFTILGLIVDGFGKLFGRR